MADWICRKCGNEIMTMSNNPPMPLNWSDGHKCVMMRIDQLEPLTRELVVKQIEENL